MEKELRRSKQGAVFGGVAAGFAKYFGIDVVIVRLIIVVSLFVSFGISLFAYLILWVVLPEESRNELNTQTIYPETVVQDPAPQGSDSDRNIKIIAIALIGFGTYMLLDQYIAWYNLGKFFWPMALIGIGAFLLLRKRNQDIAANNGNPPNYERNPEIPEKTDSGNYPPNNPGDESGDESGESFKVN